MQYFHFLDSSNQPLISLAEAAIVDCMMHGGSRLSLKAHFLTEPPDLAPLARTLTYLNLSFNNLRVHTCTCMIVHVHVHVTCM